LALEAFKAAVEPGEMTGFKDGGMRHMIFCETGTTAGTMLFHELLSTRVSALALSHDAQPEKRYAAESGVIQQEMATERDFGKPIGCCSWWLLALALAIFRAIFLAIRTLRKGKSRM
jgi:hypothetical protein